MYYFSMTLSSMGSYLNPWTGTNLIQGFTMEFCCMYVVIIIGRHCCHHNMESVELY